jgi:Zn-dependent M28 family amino/carboxypeptidase
MAADVDRLRAHVQAFAVTYAPRDAAHPKNMDRAADYIEKTMQATGARVTRQPVPTRRNTYHNVIAAFGPESRERVVVGAHYDVFGPYPGADDNASGVAGLLELARLLAKESLTVRTELVAFALEEPPHFASADMGSAVHAASLNKEGAQVRGMISLEMIGYFKDEPNTQEFPSPAIAAHYPDRGNFIVVAGTPEQRPLVDRVEKTMKAGTTLPIYSIVAPRSVPGIDLSDQRSYWEEGFPAVMLTDTSFYRNPHYHTASDRPETLDYARMAQVVDGVLSAVRHLAGSP